MTRQEVEDEVCSAKRCNPKHCELAIHFLYKYRKNPGLIPERCRDFLQKKGFVTIDFQLSEKGVEVVNQVQSDVKAVKKLEADWKEKTTGHARHGIIKGRKV